MENAHDNDSVEELNYLCSSEINVALASLRARQQKCIDRLQINTFEVALVRCQASLSFVQDDIKRFAEHCARQSKEVFESMLERWKRVARAKRFAIRLAHAERQVILKQRRLDAESRILISTTSACLASSSSRPSPFVEGSSYKRIKKSDSM